MRELGHDQPQSGLLLRRAGTADFVARPCHITSASATRASACSLVTCGGAFLDSTLSQSSTNRRASSVLPQPFNASRVSFNISLERASFSAELRRRGVGSMVAIAFNNAISFCIVLLPGRR